MGVVQGYLWSAAVVLGEFPNNSKAKPATPKLSPGSKAVRVDYDTGSLWDSGMETGPLTGKDGLGCCLGCLHSVEGPES